MKLLILLTCCALFAIPGYAGTFAFTQLCWAGNGIYDEMFDSCSNTLGPNAVSRATPNPDGGPDQLFDATATAIATDNMWKVAVDLALSDYRRDMYIWSTDPDEGFDTIATTAAATAGMNDTVTISGGTGVYSLSYIFSLDGFLFSSNNSLFQASFCASLSIPGGTVIVRSLCLSPGQTVPSTFTLTFADLAFEAPIVPTLFIQATGFVPPVHQNEVPAPDTITGALSVDFGSTIALEYLSITDPQGNPIPGVQVNSSSGLTYALDPRNAAAVPEPGWLAGGGLLMLAVIRRYRRA